MKRASIIIANKMSNILKKIKIMNRLMSAMFRIWYEVPYGPTDYYSPLPDLDLVKKNTNRWYRENCLAIRMDLKAQKSTLRQLEAYKGECATLANATQLTAEGYGLGYGEVEACFLHCMIRHLKPGLIIEVGSGVSTLFALDALRMNRREKAGGAMICIEPYPLPRLEKLVSQRGATLHIKEVQDVEISLFQELGSGDILFIDSSHVSKLDSDVNYLYLEVLPSLREGVVIHIHDIPFPYPSCMPEYPLFDSYLLWNEPALVRAFLMYNEVFQVLMCQSYLHHTCPDAMRQVVDFYDERKHFPSSLWLEKVG